MELIIEYAEEKLPGLELIELSVFKKNERARSLYEKMGFKKVAELEGTIKFEGNYDNEEIMHLWVTK